GPRERRRRRAATVGRFHRRWSRHGRAGPDPRPPRHATPRTRDGTRGTPGNPPCGLRGVTIVPPCQMLRARESRNVPTPRFYAFPGDGTSIERGWIPSPEMSTETTAHPADAEHGGVPLAGFRWPWAGLVSLASTATAWPAAGYGALVIGVAG